MVNKYNTTILLCAGKKRLATSIQTSLSNALTPVNGKPVIGWILDDLLKKGIREAVLVLREDEEPLKMFLERAYSQRMILTLATVSQEERTILHSLKAGLQISGAGSVRVVLGDTLIRDNFDNQEDFLYIGSVEESKRWCLPVISEAGEITEFLDKRNLPGGPFKAVAGYYHLADGALLQHCVEQVIMEGKRELSDALLLYGTYRPIRVREVSEWYDFGHLDTIVDAKRRLLRPRHFNSLAVNPILNTITKISQNNEKLEDELNWYLSLPAELQVLTPRILSQEKNGGQLHLVQEYYGYPTLAELYVYGDLDVETWQSILKNILNVHREFCRYEEKMEPDTIRRFYVEKTEDRVNKLIQSSPEWRERFSPSTVIYNGKEYRNLPELLPLIREKASELATSAEIRIVHGDLCFSNILYDLNSQIIRLIDPRGSFGQKGIYGDARYDIAKLRHSIAGLYDFIVADMFSVKTNENEYEAEVFSNPLNQQVTHRFDQMIEKAGYDLASIQFIEGLLFISMLPLHSDYPNRQIMMYLRGLSLLNEVLYIPVEEAYAYSH